MAMLVYTDPSGQELTVPLGPDYPVVSIGRATECTIRSNRKSVSRRHAEFHYTNGRYEVVDLGSSNGTYLIINEERKPVVQPEPLAHSDEVWCGDFILRFYEEESAGVGMGGGLAASSESFQSNDQFSSPSRPTHNFGQNGQNSHANQSGFGHQPQSGIQPTPAPVGAGVSGGLGGGLSEGSSFEFDEAPQDFGAQDFGSQDFGAEDFGAQDFDSASAGGDELQRLRDEKQSIEDLAARQAQELDDLRAQLSAKSGDDGSLERMSMELEAAQREQDRLSDELRMTQETSTEVEREQERALEAERRLEEATNKIDELRQSLEGKGGELDNRSRDLKILESELERAEKELQQAKQNSASREETDELRQEVERQERLLGEYEKRSRELQAQLDQETEAGSSMRALVEEYEGKLDGLESVVAERDELVAQVEELRAGQEDLQGLRSEIEGLKQRLRLEKQRNADAGSVEELEQQVDELQGQLAAATEGGGASGADLQVLAGHARTLGRIVDAIERTDLSPLSTVDRVRLQSAIRDTQPRKTLSEILEIVEE